MSKPVLPALRCIHLLGGCRAHHYAGNWIRLEPLALDVSELIVEVSEYAAAYAALHRIGLPVIGVDFYSDPAQVQDIRPPDWRSYLQSANTSWLCAAQADAWSQIAYGAVRQTRGHFWDVASRVSYQLRACQWRFRQLSEAYEQQLSAIVRSRKFKIGSWIVDEFTWLAYLAVQSFLIDACVLRDYLAECRAMILTPPIQASRKVTDLATLRDLYLSKIDPILEIDKELTAATEQGGWLFRLSAYRNLVVHYAPIASAGRDLYSYSLIRYLHNGGELPSVKLPIPSEPRKIIENRRTGSYLEDPDANYARFLNALKDPDSASDSLEYSWGVLGNLAMLASKLSEISPVAPRIPKFVMVNGKLTEE